MSKPSSIHGSNMGDDRTGHYVEDSYDDLPDLDYRNDDSSSEGSEEEPSPRGKPHDFVDDNDDDFEDGLYERPPREPPDVPTNIWVLKQEQSQLPALDVGKFSKTLMADLEIPDEEPASGDLRIPSDEEVETERLLGNLAVHLSSMTTVKKRKGFVDAQQLASNWKIGIEAARRTVEATTQMAVRDFSNTSGTRRLKPRHWILDQKRLSTEAYTDTLFGRCKSLRGNTCAQIYATPFHFVFAVSLKSKAEAHCSLDEFFHKFGIPKFMVADNAKELTKGQFKKKCKRAQCPMHPIEAYTSNANLAEGVIREVKRHYRRTMLETGAPEVVWDWCLEWCALVRAHTALNMHELKGKTPMTKMTGETADISFLSEFGFYNWVWYIDQEGRPGQEMTQERSMGIKKLGRYLGPSDNVGDKMCGTVLTERAQMLDRTSIIPLTEVEKNMDSVRRAKHVFEQVLAVNSRTRWMPSRVESQLRSWRVMREGSRKNLHPFKSHTRSGNQLNWAIFYQMLTSHRSMSSLTWKSLSKAMTSMWAQRS